MALMSDDDPARIIIRMDVQSFFSFVATMIDSLHHSGLPFCQFRPALGAKLAWIRDSGYTELAEAVAADLDRLELEFERLRELQTGGAPAYLEARVESCLEAWRDARVLDGPEVQAQLGRVDQVRAVLAERVASLSDIHSRAAFSEARMRQLEQELQAERENFSVLGLAQVTAEEARATMARKVELSERRLAELREEAAKALHDDEEAFRARLQEELQQAYSDELSQLEQRISCHKLNI